MQRVEKKECVYSIVVPVYNSEKTLHKFYERVTAALSPLTDSYEIIMVNDGSRDKSWQTLESLSKKDPHLMAIELTRNFGQHNALMCGFNHASGEFIITLDDDLQNPPEEIPTLIDAIKKSDADVVIGKYPSKKHNFIRNFGSNAVKHISAYTLGIPTTLDMTSFRIIKRVIVDEIINFHNPSPRIGLIIYSVTHNIINVATKHAPRKAGKSGYSLHKLVGNFLDNILNYSSLPLRLVSYIGFFFSFLSFALALFYLIMYLSGTITVSGFTTLVLLTTFFSGLILMTLGIVGEYLIRIIKASEHNPQFIVRKRHNG